MKDSEYDHTPLTVGAGDTTRSSNSLGHKWTFGPASVELHVWPPEMQLFPMNIPAHASEPRLKAACSIGVKTGFRPQCSVEDRALIESFVPVARTSAARPATRHALRQPAPQHELEFIRLPDEDFGDMYGWIGRSDDQSTLIFFGPELYLVPMTDAIQFEVARVRPAKGPGGSSLNMRCLFNYAHEKTKTLTICSAAGVEDLNELAATVAHATKKPFTLLPYEDDY